MLLIDISKIEIKIGHGGQPSIAQGDDMLDDCRADRGHKLLDTERKQNAEPEDALPRARYKSRSQ